MIYTQVWGTGAQDALLLHCSLASSDAWRGMAGHLGDNLTMTGLDFQSHGKSADWDGTGDYHAVCTKDAGDLLTRPMHLIGHSFGATVALRLAQERPEMVRSLTLIEPVFFAIAKSTNAYAEHMADFQPFVDAMQRGRHEDAARLFTEVWGTGADWDTLPVVMRDYMSKRIGLIPITAPTLYEDNAGMAVEGRLESVACPVLLAEGVQSPSIVAAINDALAARLPDVTRLRVEGASHMLPITHAGEVAGAIRGFLNA
ncbi:alpha/beta fold hydrolase [Profundibacter sp.]